MHSLKNLNAKAKALSKPTDRRIWRPYTQEKIAPEPVKLKGAEGSFLITEDGRRIYDGISSWWLITHGHCHPAIVEAVRRQAGRLDQAVFANFSHEPAEELAEKILEMTGGGFSRVFFSDNGSTAVEVALKMAHQACGQNGHPQKTKFLAFSQAYHGDTVGAMSVSARSAFSKPYETMTFDILRAEQPRNSQAPLEEWTRDFKSKLETHHQEIAAVILEPLVQGAAGMIVWPDDAVREIAALCRKFGVYLIFDEVMTGFGRTGKLFAMHRLDVSPDFICLSKGLTGGTLPLSLTLMKEEIYEAFLSDDKSRMLFHGHSFTGNPISCAAAVANLKVFESENTIERISGFSRIHEENFKKLANKIPMENVRVCGTIAAFETSQLGSSYTQSTGETLCSLAMERGLFLRTLGKTIYLLPPYSSTENELNFAWDTIAETVSDLEK